MTPNVDVLFFFLGVFNLTEIKPQTITEPPPSFN